MPNSSPVRHSGSFQLWVEYVRVIGVGLVVMLHSASQWIFDCGKHPGSSWWTANVYGSAARMCVPLFFMISGYLLLQRRNEPLLEFARKRVTKVAVPLVIWSVLYLGLTCWRDGCAAISSQALPRYLISPVFYHLWFMYAILGLYLCVPLLRASFSGWDNALCYYFIGLWFFASACLPMFERLSDTDGRFDLHPVTGYAGYFILGRMLGQRSYGKRAQVVSLGVALAMFAVTALATGAMTLKRGAVYAYFYDYFSPNVVLLSAATFILIKSVAESHCWAQSPPLARAVRTLGETSLGIYLIHAAVLDLILRGVYGWRFTYLNGNPSFAIPLTAALTFAVSFAIVYVGRMNSAVRRIFP